MSQSNTPKPEFFIEDPQWARTLEISYEEYIWKCEELIDDDSDFVPLSGEPFCGCGTCYSREQLFFLVPKIIKAYKEGKITLNEE
jgi:hypothetical protein